MNLTNLLPDEPGTVALWLLASSAWAAIAVYARSRYRSNPDRNWFGALQGVLSLGIVGGTASSVGLFLAGARGHSANEAAMMDPTFLIAAGAIGGLAGGILGWRLRRTLKANRVAYFSALPVVAAVISFMLS